MSTSIIISRPRLALPALAFSLFLSACGGSSGSDPVIEPPQPTTGTVALLFTDAPSDEFSEINLDIVQAILIGGEGVDGQQILFEGVEPIDLLDLENFSEPIIFGEVDAGIFTKLRLVIDNLELVPMDGSPNIYPALPANGKIDLLDPSGIEVLPGRTLMVEIDMDANKSIKITGAGKSGNVQFRPVVKATFWDGDLGNLPLKLARIEGTASEVPADPAGSFVLCDIETPDSCVDVSTDETTSIFDSEGLATGFGTLMVGDPVVVIGSYTVDGSITLNAAILEIGGNATQVKGNVVSDPMDSQFLMVIDENGDIVVELQPGTKYYDADGELGPEAVVLGADLEVEGVQPPKAMETDPDLIRAALVFVEAEDDEQVSGKIKGAPDAVARTLTLELADMSELCVRVNEDADILLVDIALSEVTIATFAELADGQVVDLFGATAEDTCFDANEVIVDVNASAAP